MKKNRGVITVEAALVIPVIMVTLFLLYSLAIIQYNNIVARTEAMRVANRVAINWNLVGGEGNNILTESCKPVVYKGETYTGDKALIATGKNAISSSSFEEHDPYRFLLELFTAGGKKKENIQNYMNRQMGNVTSVAQGFAPKIETTVSSDSNIHIFNRYVKVKVENIYSNPIFKVLENMGYYVESDYSVEAKAKLTEPADFVRNVTFIEETIRKMKKNGGK